MTSPAPAAPDASVPVDESRPRVGSPELIGPLVGPGATLAQTGLKLFGTDLGWTFEHRDKLVILFGDTMTYDRFYCEFHETVEDDALATLSNVYAGGVPALSFVTRAGAAEDAASMRVMRDGRALSMGLAKTPLTGFSDGEHAFSLIGRVAYTRCTPPANAGEAATCDADTGFECVTDIGVCDPGLGDQTRPCDLASGSGCELGQRCVRTPDGFCIDRSCSQYDGTASSLPFTIARDTEIAMQRADEPEVFDSVMTFASKKFHNPTARTVLRFTGGLEGNDYQPGYGTLLLWGRPGFTAEHDRQAQLYLLAHDLPLTFDAQGKLQFTPRYFAGADGATNEPVWSNKQADAVALAMDGRIAGDPSEPIHIVNQLAISWLDAPINKWIMPYAGDTPDALLLDATNATAPSSPGAVMMRFADQPWGPWSEARVHLAPGSPAVAGDAYGPGGFLYHFACADLPGQPCARTDPIRPADTYLPGCTAPWIQLDTGRLYGVNIIDAYTTRGDEDRLSIYWNVSTWNPYGVLLMKTDVFR